jgi:hypothetical protein
MPVTLLLPGLRIPSDVAAAILTDVKAPVLRSMFGRAVRGALSQHQAAPHRDWLAQHVDARVATGGAPYAFAALGGRVDVDATVWYADPIHIEVARDRLIALPVAPPPADQEAAALLAAADAIAASAGARFERAGGRWFMHAPSDWRLDTPPVEAVWGTSLHDRLPTGAAAAQWSRLLNEIQMAWHVHPVNTARESRGEPTINGVWLHGGAVWAAMPPLRYAAVASDAPELTGAALAAGTPTLARDAPWPDGTLALWSDALQPRALHDWPAWQAAVQAIDTRLADRPRSLPIDFIVSGQRSALQLRWRPRDRLKFWRAHPLEEVLSE